jgi:HSP20 family protein
MHNRLSDIFTRPTPRRDGKQELIANSEWAPLVDITESDRGYSIKAELPELKREDIKVSVENGVISISGERRFESEEKNRKYHRVERAHGIFTRSFSLPDDADPAKVNATYHDGLLTVEIEKSPHAKPRQIEVKVQ